VGFDSHGSSASSIDISLSCLIVQLHLHAICTPIVTMRDHRAQFSTVIRGAFTPLSFLHQHHQGASDNVGHVLASTDRMAVTAT